VFLHRLEVRLNPGPDRQTLEELVREKTRTVLASPTPNVHVELTVKLAELANTIEPHGTDVAARSGRRSSQ
jgi:hypothetical protein